MSRVKQRQRGAILLAALVVLVVIGAMLAGAVGMSLRGKREQNRNVCIRQSHLILDAGIARAISSLEMDSSYDGEQWDLASAFPHFEKAFVEITVERSSPETVSQVTVRARVQPDMTEIQAIQVSHAFSWSEKN